MSPYQTPETQPARRYNWWCLAATVLAIGGLSGFVGMAVFVLYELGSVMFGYKKIGRPPNDWLAWVIFIGFALTVSGSVWGYGWVFCKLIAKSDEYEQEQEQRMGSE